MNTFPRRLVYLIAFCAILAMAAFYAETSFPEKTTAATVRDPIAASATTTETVEETVELSPSDLKTWEAGDYKYPSNTVYWPCGLVSTGVGGVRPEEGEMIVGYDHYFNSGTQPTPCQEKLDHVYRGTVRFDLRGIISKAPKFHVYVSSAKLNYRKKESLQKYGGGEPMTGRECVATLLTASADWTKETKSDVLIPGILYKTLAGSVSDSICGLGGCSIEVGPMVNNWVTGKEDNNGFVIRGENEGLLEEDNAACRTSYDKFSLSVTYKYDKTTEPIFLVAAPLDMALKRTATQSSTFPGGDADHAVDGNTDGAWVKGSVAATGEDSQAWWQVDLGKVRSIGTIKVWNRAEFPERTSAFYVFVSDEPFTSTDLESTKSQVGPERSFFTLGQCGVPTEIAVGKTGRYVRVQLSKRNFLQLAEVEVFAGSK